MSKSELLEIYLDNNSVLEKRLFTCSLCPYRTDRRNNLKRHTATMHEQSAAILECCGTRFANKAALRHHTAAYHRHGYICTICGRVFCRRALLRRHHAVHSGFKEFTCSLCDYATSHKSNLERHMKIHDGAGIHLKSSQDHSIDVNEDYRHHHYHHAYDENKLGDGDAHDAHARFAASSSPGHEHNPILASLLSQPGHSDVLQWSYHHSTPYDYDRSHSHSHSHFRNHSYNQPASTIKTERRWSYESSDTSENVFAAHYFSATTSCRSLKRSGSADAALPLRHAIDVILGVKEEPSVSLEEPCVVTTASNHWSVGHVSCTVVPGSRLDDVLVYANDAADVNCDSGVESDRSSVGYKHQWPSHAAHDVDVDDGDVQVQQQVDVVYVPKKLRMSKRYQKL